MEQINERIAKVVADSGFTKTAAAEKINVTQQFISNLCLGKRTPSDRTISDICRAFHVNEQWLREGIGEPYICDNEELGALIGSVLHGEPDFRQRLLSVLLRMTPDEWALLERKAWELVREMEKGKKEAGPEGPASELTNHG